MSQTPRNNDPLIRSNVTATTIQGPTTAGVSILGRTDGVAVAAGFVGECFGTQRTPSAGVTHYSAQTTTAYNGSTTSACVSLTLNKGIYLVTALSTSQEADNTARTFYASLIHAGNGNLITQTNFGFSNVTASGRYFGGYQGVPLTITVDGTQIGLRVQVLGATTLTLNTMNEMWAVRIA